MPRNRAPFLLIATCFIAIYGIGMQPYLDLYLLVFQPALSSKFNVFKLLVVYKVLLAFLIFVSAIITLSGKKLARNIFLMMCLIHALSVCTFNGLTLLDYNELNEFFYTDYLLKYRIGQQIIWLVFLYWIFFVNKKVMAFIDADISEHIGLR